MIRPINFSPFAYNVLNAVGRTDLITPDGKSVSVERSGMDFVICIEGVEVARTPDNLSASYVLNMREVGVKA
jgi:hypothetical protein